ncbi:hypothetical protein QOT17_012438 [Balamuthia mandrillaris]
MNIEQALALLEGTTCSNEDKVAACRAVCQQLCQPSIRLSNEFGRLLPQGIALLLRTCGSESMYLWTVAEESLTRVLKTLVGMFQDRVLISLYKGFRDLGPTRVRKTALLKFSELCHHVHPTKCRKYISSLLPVFHEMVESEDELLFQAFTEALDKICSVFIFYLREKEVNFLIEQLIKRLADSNASIRRCSASCVVCLCRHYPKSPFDLAVLLIRKQLQELYPHVPSMSVVEKSSSTSTLAEEEVEAKIKERSGDNHDSNFNSKKVVSPHTLAGLLYCLLQLTALSDEWKARETDPRNPILPHIPFICNLLPKCIYHHDSNVVSVALEFLLRILETSRATSVGCNGIRTIDMFERNSIPKLLYAMDDILLSSGGGSSLRTSCRAVALRCLAQIALHDPLSFCLHFFVARPKRASSQQTTTNSNEGKKATSNRHSCYDSTSSDENSLQVKLEQLLSSRFDDDPLVRGSVAELACCIVSAILAVQTRAAAFSILETPPKHTSTPPSSFDRDSALKTSHMSQPPLNLTALCLRDGYATLASLLAKCNGVEWLIDIIRQLLFDDSAHTHKLALGSLSFCFHSLLGRPSSVHQKEGAHSLGSNACLAVLLLETVLEGVQLDSYWLTKTEAASFLSTVDYTVVQNLELEMHNHVAILHTSNRNSYSRNSYEETLAANNLPTSSLSCLGRTVTGSAISKSNWARSQLDTQARVLDFLFALLRDNDGRVRAAAASSLTRIIPNLQYNMSYRSLVASPTAAVLHRHVLQPSYGIPSLKKVYLRADILHNISHVMQRLQEQTATTNADDQLRGCFLALMMITREYVRPEAYVVDCPTSPETNLDSINDALPNPVSIYFSEFVPLMLKTLISSPTLCTDLDLHCDMLLAIECMTKKSERHGLANHWLSILVHILCVLSIMTSIIQNEPKPAHKPVEAQTSGPVKLGNYAAELVYLELFDRLRSTYNASFTSFMKDQEKFTKLQIACYRALGVLTRNVGKYIVPFAPEILKHMSAHFQSCPKAITSCLLELFMCTFHATPKRNKRLPTFQQPYLQTSFIIPPDEFGSVFLPAISSNKSTDAGTAFPKLPDEYPSLSFSLLSRRYHLREAQSLDFYASVQLPFPVVEAEKMIRNSKDLIRLFEPLVIGAMNLYKQTHDLELQRTVLFVLTQLIRFGIDFSRLDKDKSFLDHVMNQILGKKSYLPHPPFILPFIFDLLNVLFVTRVHLPRLLNTEKMLVLTSCVFSSPHWGSTGVLLPSIDSLVRDLFGSPAENTILSFSGGEQRAVRQRFEELRDELLKRILQKANLRSGITLISTILSKAQNRSVDSKRYAQPIFAALLPALTSLPQATQLATNLQDMRVLYSVMARLLPLFDSNSQPKDTAAAAKAPTLYLLKGLYAFVTSSLQRENRTKTFRQGKLRTTGEIETSIRSSLPFTVNAVTNTAGPTLSYWLPSVLAILYHLAELDETQLFILHESLELQQEQTSAGAFAELLCGIIKQASDEAFNSADTFSAQLLCHLFSLITKMMQNQTSNSAFVIQFQQSLSLLLPSFVPFFCNCIDAHVTVAASLSRLLLVMEAHSLAYSILQHCVELLWVSSPASWTSSLTMKLLFITWCSLDARVSHSSFLPLLQHNWGIDLFLEYIGERPVRRCLLHLAQQPSNYIAILRRVEKKTQSESLPAQKRLQQLALLLSTLPTSMYSLKIIVQCLQNWGRSLRLESLLQGSLNSIAKTDNECHPIWECVKGFQGMPTMTDLLEAFRKTPSASQNVALRQQLEAMIRSSASEKGQLSTPEHQIVDSTIDSRKQVSVESGIQLKHYVHSFPVSDYTKHVLMLCIADASNINGRFSINSRHLLSAEQLYPLDFSSPFATLRSLLVWLDPQAHARLLTLSLEGKESIRHLCEGYSPSFILSGKLLPNNEGLEPIHRFFNDVVSQYRSAPMAASTEGPATYGTGLSFMMLHSIPLAFLLLSTLRASDSSHNTKQQSETSLLLLELCGCLLEAFVKDRITCSARTSVTPDLQGLASILELTRQTVEVVWLQPEHSTGDADDLLFSSHREQGAWNQILHNTRIIQCLLERKVCVSLKAVDNNDEAHSQPSGLSVDSWSELVKAFLPIHRHPKPWSVREDNCWEQPLWSAFISLMASIARTNTSFTYPSIVEGTFLEYPLLRTLLHKKNDDSPESILKFMNRLLNLIGLQRKRQYEKLWAMLMAIFNSSKINEEQCSKQAQTSNVRALTSLLMLHRHLDRPFSTLPTVAEHSPRQRDLVFLQSSHGKVLSTLQEKIEQAVQRTLSPVTQPSLYCQIGRESIAYSSPFSSYHQNLERVLWPFQRYYSGQVSILQLRERLQVAESTEPTQEADSFMSAWIASIEKTIQTICSKDGSASSALTGGGGGFHITNTSLARELISAVLLFSDLFQTVSQWRWMEQVFLALMKEDSEMEDHLLACHLLLGLAKTAAVLEKDTNIQSDYLVELLQRALDSKYSALQLSALNGVLFLLEAQHMSSLIMSLSTPLFKYLLKHLSPGTDSDETSTTSTTRSNFSSVMDGGLRKQCHVLAVTFLLLEQYPKETEEQDFTRPALNFILKIASSAYGSIPKILVSLVLRGCSRLLISFSLSQSNRALLTTLASQKLASLGEGLRNHSSTHFLLALGLLLTSLYTARDPTLPQAANNDNAFSDHENSGDEKKGPTNSGSAAESSTHVSSTAIMTLGVESIHLIETVKILFERMQYGSPFEAETIADIMPRLLLDFFRTEQMMTLVLGELSKVPPESSHPALMVSIVQHVFSALRARSSNTLFRWVVMCLGSFSNIQPRSYALWAMTCLFLSATKNELLRPMLLQLHHPHFSSSYPSSARSSSSPSSSSPSIDEREKEDDEEQEAKTIYDDKSRQMGRTATNLEELFLIAGAQFYADMQQLDMKARMAASSSQQQEEGKEDYSVPKNNFIQAFQSLREEEPFASLLNLCSLLEESSGSSTNHHNDRTSSMKEKTKGVEKEKTKPTKQKTTQKRRSTTSDIATTTTSNDLVDTASDEKEQANEAAAAPPAGIAAEPPHRVRPRKKKEKRRGTAYT